MYAILLSVPKGNDRRGGGSVLKEDIGKLLADVNTAIIKVRGAYALWCKEQGITYHELLICYSIRDFGVCTQCILWY